MLLAIENLSIAFPTSRGAVTAVHSLSLAIGAGETVALVGESGSGKSVTSLALMGLLPPEARISGSIRLEGQELTNSTPDELRSLRGRALSMIFQEPMTALNPVMRVGRQIEEAILAHAPRTARAELRQRAIDALHEVAIPEPGRRVDDYPHQLSGGQRQRVMIAMALVNRPSLLIADEPTTALDVTVQAQILDLLAGLQKSRGLAMLFISHDLAVVRRVSRRIAVMYAGRIVEEATSEALFAHPLHPYTRGLLASIPTLKTDRSTPLRAIEGSVPSPGTNLTGCAFAPRCPLRTAECEAAMPELREIANSHGARCIHIG